MTESEEGPTPRVLAIDAGGTMTDTFIVDRSGSFVVGKAQTTPDDESRGLMESAEDALRQWDSTPEDHFPNIMSGVFSGTAMLNRLLSRKGLDVGVIVTAGQEDNLTMERGIQSYLGYSYADRLHIATHHHNEPLVPRERVFGVRGRIDMFGAEVLPLREEDAREATRELLDAGVKGICVCLLFCYANTAHEERVKEIIEEERDARGSNGDVPLFISSELYPARRDFPRLNTTVIEGYAAEPSRDTLRDVRDKTKERGAGFELRVMASHGGTISIDAAQLATTLVSGPIGGVVGARWLAEQIDLNNVLCTDIGGTSFDIALLTEGRYEVVSTPNMAKFMLNMPLVQIDSVGARLRLLRAHRPERPPAGDRPRLGRRDDRHLLARRRRGDGLDHRPEPGARAAEPRLLPGRAGHARRRARPLRGQAPDRRPARARRRGGRGRDHRAVRGLAPQRGRGAHPRQGLLARRLHRCSATAAAGPCTSAATPAGIPYQQILVPEWAAGFSAFGCACADFEYRFDRQVDLAILPTQTDEERVAAGAKLTEAWRALEDGVRAEFEKSGYGRGDVTFVHGVRMQYFGQLIDIEVDAPKEAIESAEDVDDLLAAFEHTYARMYARAASSPELGYLVAQAIVKGSVPIEKPTLPQLEAVEGSPEVKETRQVWWDDGFQETDIYEMTDIRNGHSIDGPAVFEAESTTFIVTPDRRISLDEHGIFHLENKEG